MTLHVLYQANSSSENNYKRCTKYLNSNSLKILESDQKQAETGGVLTFEIRDSLVLHSVPHEAAEVSVVFGIRRSKKICSLIGLGSQIKDFPPRKDEATEREASKVACKSPLKSWALCSTACTQGRNSKKARGKRTAETPKGQKR